MGCFRADTPFVVNLQQQTLVVELAWTQETGDSTYRDP